MLLKQLKRLADRGRLDFQFPGGGRNRAFTSDALKNADLVVYHVIHYVVPMQPRR